MSVIIMQLLEKLWLPKKKKIERSIKFNINIYFTSSQKVVYLWRLEIFETVLLDPECITMTVESRMSICNLRSIQDKPQGFINLQQNISTSSVTGTLGTYVIVLIL
jgi:hypothetical protein